MSNNKNNINNIEAAQANYNEKKSLLTSAMQRHNTLIGKTDALASDVSEARFAAEEALKAFQSAEQNLRVWELRALGSSDTLEFWNTITDGATFARSKWEKTDSDVLSTVTSDSNIRLNKLGLLDFARNKKAAEVALSYLMWRYIDKIAKDGSANKTQDDAATKCAITMSEKAAKRRAASNKDAQLPSIPEADRTLGWVCSAADISNKKIKAMTNAFINYLLPEGFCEPLTGKDCDHIARGLQKCGDHLSAVIKTGNGCEVLLSAIMAAVYHRKNNIPYEISVN